MEMIKDYASQYCVAKSLPFTAASMAMECVCAAVSTIVTGGISMQAISALEKAGHKHEVNRSQLCMHACTNYYELLLVSLFLTVDIIVCLCIRPKQ